MGKALIPRGMLDVSDLVERWGVVRQTIYGWVKDKRLRPHKSSGGHGMGHYFDLAVVESFENHWNLERVSQAKKKAKKKTKKRKRA